MNSLTQLESIIADLQSEGIRAKITVLPSTTLRQRKSSLGVKRSASRRRSGNTQMQDCNKIYHSSGHNQTALTDSPGQDFKLFVVTLFVFIMTRETALGLLAQGNNGKELLTILDVIFADVIAQEVGKRLAE